jgi:glycosyltransferase involved in cell wall biosynthesis
MNLLLFNLKLDADDDVLGFTTEWVNALARRCDRVIVITMTAGRVAVASNVTVHSVGRELGYSEPRRALRFYSLLNRVLREQRIDACFAHMIPLFAVMGWPLLRARGIPILLWYAHGTLSPMARIGERLVDVVLASTPSGFPMDTPKLRVIGQGIDTTRFVPGSRQHLGDARLLCVGRISRIKRLDVAIRSLQLLTGPQGAAARMRFVGRPLTEDDASYARELRQLAQTHGVSERVEFVDSIPFAHVHSTYTSADVFVNSSETNSADKSVLEAMSCGIPIVTSNPAFVQLLPADLHASCIVPPGDHVALAARLSHVLAIQAPERMALGDRLRAVVVAHHSLEALSGKIIEQVRAARAVLGVAGRRE